MWGMSFNWLSAQGSATASWEVNLPPNHYVVAQCALNMFINTTGSSGINVYSYTHSNGNKVNFSYPNQPPSVWEQGILNVTFGLYAYGSFTTGNAWVSLW
jgi:hypothetical protein